MIQDRWDKINFPTARTVEDLKERYYSVVNILTEARTPPGQELKIKYFDADHERRRKEQLTKLYDRTSDQVEEEQKLLEELRRIEMRKKEREKKTQDLQKLITAADKSADRPDLPANKQGILIHLQSISQITDISFSSVPQFLVDKVQAEGGNETLNSTRMYLLVTVIYPHLRMLLPSSTQLESNSQMLNQAVLVFVHKR